MTVTKLTPSKDRMVEFTPAPASNVLVESIESVPVDVPLSPRRKRGPASVNWLPFVSSTFSIREERGAHNGLVEDEAIGAGTTVGKRGGGQVRQLSELRRVAMFIAGSEAHGCRDRSRVLPCEGVVAVSKIDVAVDDARSW